MRALRRIMVAAVLAVLTLGLSTTSAHDEFRFVGIVVGTEPAKKRFSMKFKEADGKDETVQIALTPKTVITRDKKTIPASALKAGLHVVVDALGDDYDNLDAVEIRIVPPPAK